MGFFVYRHLGLVGCNIAIMKRFLSLTSFLLITCSLSGQSCENKDSLVDERQNYKFETVEFSNGLEYTRYIMNEKN